MKKIFTLVLLLLSFSLLACSTTSSLNTTEESSELTTSTTIGTTIETTTNPKSPLFDIAPSKDMCNGIENIGEWEIYWCDEFNYRGLPDPKKWRYDTGGGGWGNNELQYYTNANRNNVFVEDDNLVITARKEKVGNNNYTSTRINSSGKFEFKYGKVEIRAKLPSEKGTWPALWMLGNYGRYGWPGCGEVDIMEHVAMDLNVIHGSIHTQNYNHKVNTQKTDQMVLEDVVNEYHVYGIEWTPKQIRFYIDGIYYFTFNNDESGEHDNWPFDDNMFFIINLAIGGWGGTVDSKFNEAKMYVDYIRVYKKEIEEIDTTSPSDFQNIRTVTNNPVNTTITWDEVKDDIGVKQYDLYLNDIYHGSSLLNYYSFTNLTAYEDYQVKIIASDFAGNSSTGEFTFKAQYDTVPGIIQAEDFIEMFGIQLENCWDIGRGKNVGYMDKDDFMIYQINVTEAGTYKMKYRVASQSAGGAINLYFADKLIAEKAFGQTGGWQKWTFVETETFELEKGIHTIKLLVTKSGFNLNYFEFIKVE